MFGAVRIGRDAEAELGAHPQHHGVLGKDLAMDAAQADRLGVFDDALHQQPTEPVTLERGSDDHGVFAGLAVVVEMQPHDPEHLGRDLVDCDERHGAVVVDVGELRDARVGQFR